MLICLDCGAIFEQARIVFERHGLDTPPYEELLVCPRCESAEIHSAHRCGVCGEWITDAISKRWTASASAATAIPAARWKMTNVPLKYVECAVTMEEVPTQISLTISISNCRFRCHGCHSAYLQQDVGKPLLPDLMTLLRRYEG